MSCHAVSHRFISNAVRIQRAQRLRLVFTVVVTQRPSRGPTHTHNNMTTALALFLIDVDGPQPPSVQIKFN